MAKPEDTIPEQRDGSEITVEEYVLLDSVAAAKAFFLDVKDRLLHVNKWQEISGTLSADFQLTDEKGETIDSSPQKGNYVKINIPEPKMRKGEDFDWVRVEEVIEDNDGDGESIAIKMRPAVSPVDNNNDVAHFFTDEATSNFIVKRQGTKVTAGVYGRNEKPNVKAETLIDRVRNAVVGSGAASGISKLQWKALVNGLLDKA
ncbi:MAG: hypothetical protein M3Y85_08525 [Bacteroidota bacterium]|nr:hypothetical protein [Bacteroidota bacterium]